MTTLDEIQTRADAAPTLPADARMDAYYYGFDRTGVDEIDAVLSAVAIAGKGSHHTESWGNGDSAWYYTGREGLPDAEGAAELIEETAKQSAQRLAQLKDDNHSLVAALRAVEAVHEPVDALMYTGKSQHHKVQVCTGCGQDDGNWQKWPCPSIRAIREALG